MEARDNTIPSTKQEPQVFFKNIMFNDETCLQLEHNDILVFTGANNCGKSQVLKDAENCLNASSHFPTVIIKKAEFDFHGQIDEPIFFKNRFFKNPQGFYESFERASQSSMVKRDILLFWQQHTLHNDMHLLFVNRLSTEFRLNSSNALNRFNQPEHHPIYHLNKNESLAQIISDYFAQAFGVDLIVNRNEMKVIPLHIGRSPDKMAYTISTQDEYYKQVAALPKLEDQGDGMRSFASILLDTFTSDHTITLIDEPEAFLHPPQARLLGKMLAKNNPRERQLIISTHSEDFLQGLLDADTTNIKVIRIDRIENINHMSILQNDGIKKLWSNPLLRYSNILSGLFHEKVIVCESDYDCLFYQAIMNTIFERKKEIAPDVLFTHCGGKNRVKDVVKALKAVNVPVAAICDFDLLNSSSNFKSITASFGIDWDSELASEMKIIYDSTNAENSNGNNNVWDHLKKIGKSGFSDNAPAAYERVEKTCQSAGLFIVPVGEMECFDKTINKEKREWVYEVLEKYDLVTEPKLKSVRQFMQSIISFHKQKTQEQ